LSKRKEKKKRSYLPISNQVGVSSFPLNQPGARLAFLLVSRIEKWKKYMKDENKRKKN
jgi:hypothetical protein